MEERWHHVDIGDSCHDNALCFLWGVYQWHIGGLRVWGMGRIWSRSWFWHESGPDSVSDMVVAQTLVLLWLWPRLLFWCGLGLQLNKAFLLQCFLSAVLECRPQLRLNNWLGGVYVRSQHQCHWWKFKEAAFDHFRVFANVGQKAVGGFK